ncbi:MAG: hypothetical protein ACI9BG_000357 [Parasphingorhabdus sp.]|mgnify:CR=1 FL=1|jgi:hypothetical protein
MVTLELAFLRGLSTALLAGSNHTILTRGGDGVFQASLRWHLSVFKGRPADRPKPNQKLACHSPY